MLYMVVQEFFIVENLFKLFVLYIMIKVFDPAENECYTAKSVFGTNSF